MTLRDLWISLRPEQWVKNGFVLAALVFSLHLTDADAVVRTLLALVVFCLASSAAYVGNDIVDAARDTLHADKRNRPVAAGRISGQAATALSVALALAALAGAAWLGASMVLCVLAFLALQATYSLVLKHVAVLDVVAIASGFVLRTLAGVVAAGARMSAWLFLATFLLALFLALAKRRAEIRRLGGGAAAHRPVLAVYGRLPLDAVIAALALAVVGLYTGYTLSDDVALRLGTERLVATVPFVVCGVFRYLFLLYGRDRGGNPTEALLGDRPLMGIVALWAAVSIALIYL